MKPVKPLLFALLLCITVSASAQQIYSISPRTILGGIGEILTIKGSGFGAMRGNSYVSFFRDGNIYSDANEGNGFNYISWSNTEIKLQMPVAYSNKIKVLVNGVECISPDTLHATANLGYRQANPLVYDLLTDINNKGGITWYVHPVYWNNPDIKQAIAEVVQEFRCKTGVNYILELLTPWAPVNLAQGKYIIGPDSALGVVGFNDRMWSSCIVGAETFYHNKVQLLRFNTQQTWYYGKGQPPAGASKFRYVLYHEMGHSLGLGHVNEPGQSMFPSVTLLPSDNWCSRDSITTSERRAIQYYISLCQGFAFRGCGITPMKPNTDCTDVFGASSTVPSQTYPNTLSVYPNPANDYLIINLPNYDRAEVEIRDINGALRYSAITEQGQKLFLPEKLPTGIYSVRVLLEHGSQVVQIIIEH